MTTLSKTDSNLVRIFKKVGNTIADFTRARQPGTRMVTIPAYASIVNTAAMEAIDKAKGTPVKPVPTPNKPSAPVSTSDTAKVQVKTRTVTVPIPEPRKRIEDKKPTSETSNASLNDRGVVFDNPDPKAPAKIYYIKNGNYYVMWYGDKLWCFSMSNPYWAWLTTFVQDSHGSFVHAEKSALQDIIKGKYSWKELQLNYHYYRPTDWNFKTDKERLAYMEMNGLVNFGKAIKV